VVGDGVAEPNGSDANDKTIGMPVAAAPVDRGWETELSGWRVALSQAERANRNVLQYAAAFAALLGISAGSGGVFAMAKAINENGQLVPEWALSGAFAVAAICAIVLVCLLWSAYRTRRRAERHADEHFRRLIERRPELFLPRPGGR
jgi:hypothetical protein